MTDCLRPFLLLQTPLQIVVSIEKDNLPAKIINIISNRTFFSDIEQLYSIIKTLSYVMKMIQSHRFTLADCYLTLLYLYVSTSNIPKQSGFIDFSRYVSKVAKVRLDEFQNPYYLTCFYLHPKYRGAGLLSQSRSTVYRCVAEYSKLIGNNASTTKNVISTLQRYEIKTAPYSLVWNKSKYYLVFPNLNFTYILINIDNTPTAWWCMIRDSTHGNRLQQISPRLLSITPHSVMPERLFPILS